jgi:hypothetical protein
MPEVSIELNYEKILEAALKLRDEEKERLLLNLNRDLSVAVESMRSEAWESHRKGQSTRLRDLK